MTSNFQLSFACLILPLASESYSFVFVSLMSHSVRLFSYLSWLLVETVYLVTARRARFPRHANLRTVAFDVCLSNVHVVLSLLEQWPLPVTMDSVHIHVYETSCVRLHSFSSHFSFDILRRIYLPSSFNFQIPLQVGLGINSPHPFGSCSPGAEVFPSIVRRANTLFPNHPAMYLAPHL